MQEDVTLIRPDPDDRTPGTTAAFPVDLLLQSAGRLRVLALLYAFVFFMAGVPKQRLQNARPNKHGLQR